MSLSEDEDDLDKDTLGRKVIKCIQFSGYIINVHTLSLFLFEEYTIIQSEDTNLREILARMVYCCDSW